MVSGVATPGKNVLDMIDPQTGVDKKVEVDWRSALEIDVKQKRSRPFGYVLASSEAIAASRLLALGVSVLLLAESVELNDL